jgi:hypothetical protein
VIAATNVSLRQAPARSNTRRVTRLALTALLLFALFAGAAAARGNDNGARGGDGDDIRVAASCGRGATASLRIRSRDDRIEVRFPLRQTREWGSWRVTIVHESRVAARVTARTRRGGDSFEVRRTFADLPGSDTVVVHAWGPGGLGCRAGATLADR